MSKSKNKIDEDKKMERLPEIKSIKVSPVMSFDVYFQVLMKEHVHIKPHHKAPMRKFAHKRGLGDSATKKQYDEIFRNY